MMGINKGSSLVFENEEIYSPPSLTQSQQASTFLVQLTL